MHKFSRVWYSRLMGETKQTRTQVTTRDNDGLIPVARSQGVKEAYLGGRCSAGRQHQQERARPRCQRGSGWRG